MIVSIVSTILLDSIPVLQRLRSDSFIHCRPSCLAEADAYESNGYESNQWSTWDDSVSTGAQGDYSQANDEISGK